MSQPKVSIIVRTFNEERWITHCLRKIKEQTIQDVEIVLVDNASTDRTVDKALAEVPDLIRINLNEFRPGHAINEGIRASSGAYLVCLSAHCLPVQPDWLEKLLENFKEEEGLAGVYGRQIPMSYSSAHDKRDLLVTFGLDRRVQYKDPFFHNANSMITREVWEKHPFDEDVTNIEDRVWAKKVLSAGYHIAYEPDAPVFHHHGIHQNNDDKRARSVVRVMEETLTAVSGEVENPMGPDNLDVLAILPVRRHMEDLSRGEIEQLTRSALASVKEATAIDRLIVSTDDETISSLSQEYGNAVPFLRSSELLDPEIRVDHVLQHVLESLEKEGDYPDLIVSLEITHPFRSPGLMDAMILRIAESGLDSVVAGYAEFRPSWTLKGETYQRLDHYQEKRNDREPLHVGLPALGCVSLASVIRTGSRLGKQTGIYEVHDPFARVDIRNHAAYSRVAAALPHSMTSSKTTKLSS